MAADGPKPVPEGPEPPPVDFVEKENLVARKVKTVEEGDGVLSIMAEDGMEVLVATTEGSSVHLRGSTPLRFHLGWSGVPPAWHSATKLMFKSGIVTFHAEPADIWGPPGGLFETFLEEPRPPLEFDGKVSFELELKERWEIRNVLPDVPEEASDALSTAPVARFWVRQSAAVYAGLPEEYTNVDVHLKVRAAPPDAIAPADDLAAAAPTGLGSDGELMLDTNSAGTPMRLALEEGFNCHIFERVIRAMKNGDRARLVLAPGALSKYGSLSDRAPDPLKKLAEAVGPLEVLIDELTFVDTDALSGDELLAHLGGIREEGNSRFRRGEFALAVKWYEKGLYLLRPRTELTSKAFRQQVEDLHNEEAAKRVDAAKLAIYTNMALCHIRSPDPNPRQAIECCEKALQIDPESVKALARKGRAHAEVGECEEAELALNRALQLQPGDKGIRKELTQARQIASDAKKKQKEMFKGKLDKIEGFATEDRTEDEDVGHGLNLAVPDNTDFGYKMVIEASENPYTLSSTPREEAVQCQAEGDLEGAIWAWEATIAKCVDHGDWPQCWFCWLELARLYMDVRGDAVAILCLERFISPGGLPTPPPTLLRHAQLLCAYCFLNQAPGERVAAVEKCLEAWLCVGEVGGAKKMSEDSATQLSGSSSLAERLEAEISRSGGASSVDAAIALGLHALVRDANGVELAFARAVALPEEADGSLFGSKDRRGAKWTMLGTVLAKAGRRQHAITAYAKALACQPHLPRALVNLSLVLTDNSQLKWAADLIGYALRITPRSIETTQLQQRYFAMRLHILGEGPAPPKPPPEEEVAALQNRAVAAASEAAGLDDAVMRETTQVLRSIDLQQVVA